MRRSKLILCPEFNEKIGDWFSWRGQVYTILKIEPHIRLDGKESRIVHLESVCPKCKKRFELTKGISLRAPKRRCSNCKNPHKRVVLSKSYRQNFGIQTKYPLSEASQAN